VDTNKRVWIGPLTGKEWPIDGPEITEESASNAPDQAKAESVQAKRVESNDSPALDVDQIQAALKEVRSQLVEKDKQIIKLETTLAGKEELISELKQTRADFLQRVDRLEIMLNQAQKEKAELADRIAKMIPQKNPETIIPPPPPITRKPEPAAPSKAPEKDKAQTHPWWPVAVLIVLLIGAVIWAAKPILFQQHSDHKVVHATKSTEKPKTPAPKAEAPKAAATTPAAAKPAAPAPKPAAPPAPVKKAVDPTVHIVNGSSCYHATKCWILGTKHRTTTTLSAAKSKGYSPCRYCKDRVGSSS
jgi:predicted lipid-binding transport protein (Tim44 family)